MPPHAEVIVETETDRVTLRLEIDDLARPLDEILARRGFPLNTRCGLRGQCRGCLIDLRAGEVQLPDGVVSGPGPVRACQARVAGEASVRLHLPERTRLDVAAQVGEVFLTDAPFQLDPPFPVRGNSDTVFACDLGTTTAVVAVADLATGAVLARAGGYNAQVRFGDNVLTRIAAAADPAVRQAAQAAAVRETILPLLAKACARAGRDPSRLAGGTVAGNTTMLHLLAGEDPRTLGFAPFTPVFLESRTLTLGQLGLVSGGENGNLAPDLPVILLPGFGSYVGADLVAGVQATGLVFDDAPGLLVDIGTNGEIVLHHEGRILATAAAAGPAFEGAGLTSGTRAHEGAVSDIVLAGDPFRIDARTIGNRPVDRSPGICGSAYLDFLAEGRRLGLLAPSGRFNRKCYDSLPAAFRDQDEFGLVLRLADQARISEVDVAGLLQAKAAIGAAIGTLLAAADLTPARIGRLDLAGGFGLHLNVPNAIAIGLLPGFRPEQVRVVGNTSLAGALLAALDRSALDDMKALAGQARCLELNLQPGFSDRYLDELALP